MEPEPFYYLLQSGQGRNPVVGTDPYVTSQQWACLVLQHAPDPGSGTLVADTGESNLAQEVEIRPVGPSSEPDILHLAMVRSLDG